MDKVRELKAKNSNENDEGNFADNEDENNNNEIGNGNDNNNEFGIGVGIGTNTEMGIDSEMNLLPANKYIKCCWNCLKVLLEENSIRKIFEETKIKEKVKQNHYFSNYF